VGVAVAVIVLLFAYSVALSLTSRRRRARPMPAPDNLFFVFMVPCLNEEMVIAASLERLLAVAGDNFAVLVIDDGSDATPDIVGSFDPQRVWLLRREPPEARKGKGEALNNAYRYLLDSGVLAGRDPHDVVVGVVDADGRLASNALLEVAPYFRDPSAGAVQIGVRIYNADESVLARMQDLEFVVYTEVFQRARQRMGSVGLGGNGQFARLSALADLDPAPWTACLTEDLDLGLRMLTLGWTNNYCPTTHVSQQGVTSLRRLVRQRSRWFQGHLQCWRRIPMVLRSDLPPRAVFDLTQHLLSPALVLLMSLPIALFYFTMLTLAVSSPQKLATAVVGPGTLAPLFWYVLAFGMAPFYGFVYWLANKDMKLRRAVVLAHGLSLYTYLWLPAGWYAVVRMVTGKGAWAKTARTADSTPPVATAG